MHRQTNTHAHWSETLRHRPALLGLALLLGGWTIDALAVCSHYSGSTSLTSATISSLPASIKLEYAKIGEVMASTEVKAGHSASWSCTSINESWGMTKPTTGLPLSDESKKIYATGIPGVGIRVGFRTSSQSTADYPPYGWQSHAYIRSYQEIAHIEFIRTDTAVGKGEFSFDYESTWYINASPKIEIKVSGTQLKTKLEHSVYFTSCYNPSADPTVDLGRPAVVEVSRGETTEQSFSMDIRCDGMNPTTKPPVKIYFEGNAVRDGLLALNNSGEDGVAKGVGIAVATDKGVALPINKKTALPLTWTASAVDSELYRFAGKARYTPTGGVITPGKADGTLTYILEYN